MIIAELPYFMTNDDWFYFDEAEWKYKLTQNAPQEAVDSYNEHYKLLEQNKIKKESIL